MTGPKTVFCYGGDVIELKPSGATVVCGVSIWADTIQPVRYEESE